MPKAREVKVSIRSIAFVLAIIVSFGLMYVNLGLGIGVLLMTLVIVLCFGVARCWKRGCGRARRPFRNECVKILIMLSYTM